MNQWIMINFKKVELKDKQWIEPLIVAGDPRGSHVNFVNLFIWLEIFKYQVAQVDNYLIVKANKAGEPCYFYPAGWGEITPVLETLKKDAHASKHPFVLVGLSPEEKQIVKGIYPGKFTFEAMRDSFDYVYLLEKMVSLSGKKLHAKRNHNNYFKANNNWSFEIISAENFEECKEMNSKWCEMYGTYDNGELDEECCAVKRAFKYYDELPLEGAILRVDNRVIAYTMGEQLNSDTYVIHIEKAFGEIRGAYQMINREFAEWVQNNYPQLVYINREEDMGFAGLRKAKRSYYPEKMEEKYWGTYSE